MIFGKFRKNVVGTTKLDGVEILGKLSRRRKIEATRYDTKIEALSAISNYCHSWKFQKMVIERWNLVLNLIHPTINDKYFYIRVNVG
tara:strand:+ start:41 stop:301 length:261 start_codon:yes stop_codon:yes gene_type:complete